MSVDEERSKRQQLWHVPRLRSRCISESGQPRNKH